MAVIVKIDFFINVISSENLKIELKKRKRQEKAQNKLNNYHSKIFDKVEDFNIFVLDFYFKKNIL